MTDTTDALVELTPEQIADGWVAHDGVRMPIWSGSASAILRAGQAVGIAPTDARWRWDWRLDPFKGTLTLYPQDRDIIAYRKEPTNADGHGEHEGQSND